MTQSYPEAIQRYTEFFLVLDNTEIFRESL